MAKDNKEEPGKSPFKSGRKHRALYSKDKRTGKWNVRVVGPHANMFAGREIPVETQSGEEHMEKLDRLAWTGIDEGVPEKNIKGTGLPAALYTFTQKPREEREVEF